MCGISGYIGNFGQNLIHDMVKSIKHRGPDASGVYQFNAGALGHNRLAIIDLDNSSNQPMFSSNDRFVIVFNGEIYNFKSLKKDLETQGQIFNTDGDTEVLLRLWELNQAECLKYPDGIFSKRNKL